MKYTLLYQLSSVFLLDNFNFQISYHIKLQFLFTFLLCLIDINRLIRKVGHKIKKIGALNYPMRAEKDEVYML